MRIIKKAIIGAGVLACCYTTSKTISNYNHMNELRSNSPALEHLLCLEERVSSSKSDVVGGILGLNNSLKYSNVEIEEIPIQLQEITNEINKYIQLKKEYSKIDEQYIEQVKNEYVKSDRDALGNLLLSWFLMTGLGTTGLVHFGNKYRKKNPILTNKNET